jgi:hypothetical protein
MQQQKPKCLICEYRPAQDGSPYCHNCKQKIVAETASQQRETPEKYLYYRGNWVGMYRVSSDTLKPQYLGYAPIEKKPKYPLNRTLNLDGYLVGFTRDQIRKLKRCILQLSAVVPK